MSGLSPQQRSILQLAATVNAATQGGVRRIKRGAPLTGYFAEAVDYRGPVDVLAGLLLWTFTDAHLRRCEGQVFRHTRASLCAKASLVRAASRLRERGALVFAPRHAAHAKSGYVLTEQGMREVEPWQLDVPALPIALEFFGITPLQVAAGADYWPRHHQRRRALFDQLAQVQRLSSGSRCRWVTDGLARVTTPNDWESVTDAEAAR